MEEETESLLSYADTVNRIAALVVGHRRILVDGGFDVNLADQMCASLHARLLGLDILEPEEPQDTLFYSHEDEDD